MLAAIAVAWPYRVPAHAQSFLEKVFGSVSQAQSLRTAAPLRLPPGAGFLRSYGRGQFYYQSYRRYSPDELGYDNGGRTYQTMCVRMCDGYYWPISAASTRGQFYEDAAQCAASCTGEARLFYRPLLGENPAAMTDLSGRVYGRLPTAFLYRKTQVEGCACRPVPWAESELDRHRRYALLANPAGDWRRNDVNAEPVAGTYGPRPVERDAAMEQGLPDERDAPEIADAAPPPAYSDSAILRPVPRRIYTIRAFAPRGSPSAPPSRYPWPGDAQRRGRY